MTTRLLITFLTVIFFAGCTIEEYTHKAEAGKGTGEKTLKVTMKIPATRPAGASTYALTAKQECDITSIDVLVFDSDGYFLYHETGSDILDGDADNERSFLVRIRTSDDSGTVTAFVYANVHDIIAAAVAENTGWITTATTKAEVIEELVFDLPVDGVQGGKWLVSPPGNYTLFPMWGRIDEIDTEAAEIIVPEVHMLRAVAKIDVGLNFPTTGSPAVRDVPEGLDNFTLYEVYLYNANNQLQIAPTLANLDGTGTVVTAPSVPEDAEVFGDADNPDNPISYIFPYNDSAFRSIMGEIYLAEHVEGSADADERSKNPCIVIGGRFGSPAANITYYRIDLVNTTVEDDVTVPSYLPVLRNHRYKVNITAVYGRGYGTPREAFDAEGLNTHLTAVITSDDELVTEITYDWQYMLGVDRKAVTVDKNPHNNMEIYINTNYPTGWEATSHVSWLTLGSTSGSSEGSRLTYSVAAYTGTVNRTGTITLQAGRLSMDIEVTQLPTTAIEILDVPRYYPMDGSDCTFTLKSGYNWKARVEDDNGNIVADFDLSGTANPSGAAFNFTLINDVALNHPIEEQTAKFTFYSVTGEFAPVAVDILGISRFDIGSFWLYPVDQPMGESWYVYANVPDNENSTAVPPAGPQAFPIRKFSCAAIPSANSNKPWRLPTENELSTISSALRGNLAHYGINDSGAGYRTATSFGSTSAYFVIMNSGSSNSNGKVATNGRVRCIRDK